MTEEERPDPNELLQAARAAESQKKSGRLKIFLGMSAGVGKTYTMLEDAQILHKQGVDLVVGVVQTHGRIDTAELLKGLRVLPQKKIIYKGKPFDEFDIDEVLRIKPSLVLVDELAHSNVPGARHPKRWQDVIELLENGIDVYSTLNVQHIESLKDVLNTITGISISETVPDLIIQTAASIELVDITPQELLQRLKEGKVYLGEGSAIAAANFFQEDRLTALREIVLRYAAEKVDHDLHGMVSSAQRATGWRPRERLLVAVSHSPYAQKLIRTTRRIAFNLDAPWVAVYVNNGQTLDEDEGAMLAKNLSLARDLGAEVITTNDTDIAAAIERVARQKGVTQVIIGRPEKKTFFDCLGASRSLLGRLARECSEIDIHVIRQPKQPGKSKKIHLSFLQKQFVAYFSVFLLVCFIAGVNWLALPLIGYKLAGFFFLVGILVLSLFFKKGPIFFGSLLYALIWEFFFISPLGFGMPSKEDNALLVLYFLTAIVTGILADRARENKEILAQREESAQALYEIVREMATASSVPELLKTVQARLEFILNGTCEIFIKSLENGLIFPDTLSLSENTKEKNAAIWVFENGKEAGWSTSTLPASNYLYIPLKGFNEVVGVLAYKPKKTGRLLSIEEKNFLYTVEQQLAHYLEKAFSKAKARQAEYSHQKEAIHQQLLNLISEELHQPLSKMQTAVKEVIDTSKLKEDRGANQFQQIEGLFNGVNQILSNIATMVLLNEGTVPLRKEKHSIKDLLEDTCNHLKHRLNDYDLKIVIQEELPLILFDFSLIEILLENLLSNAMENSPVGSVIELDAKMRKGYLVISVLDEGKGIPEDDTKAIFEKFYRLPGTAKPSFGLGLAIAKSIAEMHEGYLKAENRAKKGAKVSFFLPIEP